MEPDSLSMPSPVPETLVVPTLNQTGFMTTWIDPYVEAFIQFAPMAPGPCIDIGAAYGVATLAALATGAEVISCDPDERHLQICAERAPVNEQNRLKLLQGSLPDEIPLEKESVGAIVCSRVLHFLRGDEIERSIQNMFRWLKPNGKVYLIADTPYNQFFKAFQPLYEAQKQRGDPWPGQIDQPSVWIPEKYASCLPNYFHTLDPDILTRVCTTAGFHVERAGFFSRLDYPAEALLDGREGAGIIAYKA
jgi:SAM-dependent methyltransferase